MMNNIESWIYRAFLGDTIPYKDGAELRVCCPFCKDEGKGQDQGYHLYISLVEEAAHCFRCDFGTRSYTYLISRVEGITMSDAVNQMRSEGESLTPLYVLRRKEIHDSISDQLNTHVVGKDFMTISDAFEHRGLASYHALAAASYMERRLCMLKLDVSWKYYCHVWGVFTGADGYGKLVFPIEDGWWQYRHIMADYTGPKYVSCSRPKEWRLYNAKALEMHKIVYVAEGVISAASIGLNCIALCGKKSTPQQIERLGKSNVDVFVLCLDFGTRNESLWLADTLHKQGKQAIIRSYSSGDPASCNDYNEYTYSFSSGVAARLGHL